jgi:hypothetical protein
MAARLIDIKDVVLVNTREDIPENPPGTLTLYFIKDESAAALVSKEVSETFGGRTADYEALSNKPSINGVELSGNLTADQLNLADDVIYEHVQTIPAETWNIQHNLGKKFVNVLIVDQNDEEIIGSEDWGASTANLLVVKFSEPLSGKAYIR